MDDPSKAGSPVRRPSRSGSFIEVALGYDPRSRSELTDLLDAAGLGANPADAHAAGGAPSSHSEQALYVGVSDAELGDVVEAAYAEGLVEIVEAREEGG